MLKDLAKKTLATRRKTKYNRVVKAKSSAYDKWQRQGEKEPVIKAEAPVYYEENEDGKPTDRAVYVFNTHLDLAFQAKLEGAIILAEFIAKRKHDDPVFITGDMNCAKDSLPMRYFAGERIETKIEDKEYDAVSPVKLQDVYGVLYPDTDETTYHGWGRRSSGVRIDFVWTSPGLEPVSSRVIKDKAHGLCLTDHYPVEAVVRLH